MNDLFNLSKPRDLTPRSAAKYSVIISLHTMHSLLRHTNHDTRLIKLSGRFPLWQFTGQLQYEHRAWVCTKVPNKLRQDRGWEHAAPAASTCSMPASQPLRHCSFHRLHPENMSTGAHGQMWHILYCNHDAHGSL